VARTKTKAVFVRYSQEEYDVVAAHAKAAGHPNPHAWVASLVARELGHPIKSEPDRLAGIEAELGGVRTALRGLEAMVSRVLVALNPRHPQE
jgi:hypothetical protein